MADRTAAEIFGKVFSLLAENPTEENIKIARKLYDEREYYDFTDDQMDCDPKTLYKLKLPF